MTHPKDIYIEHIAKYVNSQFELRTELLHTICYPFACTGRDLARILKMPVQIRYFLKKEVPVLRVYMF